MLVPPIDELCNAGCLAVRI